MFWVAVVSGSRRAVSLSAGEIVAALAIASLNRAIRAMNPSISPGSMKSGPLPPESRPMTSSIDQPSSTASLRAAMAAWSGLGASDQVFKMPAAFAARRAAASASAGGEPANLARPFGVVSSMLASAVPKRCRASRARSATGPSSAASVVAAATKDAACRHT